MNTLRDTLGALDEAMLAIELRGEVGPTAELMVAGVIERLALADLDARSVSAMLQRMRGLVHRAADGEVDASDELWAHVRVLRERLACRLGRELSWGVAG